MDDGLQLYDDGCNAQDVRKRVEPKMTNGGTQTANLDENHETFATDQQARRKDQTQKRGNTRRQTRKGGSCEY